MNSRLDNGVMTIGPNGVRYIIVSGLGAGFNLSVLKDHGASVLALGGRGFSSTEIYDQLGIAVGLDNTPYIAYTLDQDSYK